MGGSQHKAAVKALHQDLYLAENWEGVPEMRDRSQEISYFEIEYHKNANISIRSSHGNENYLSVQPDDALRFSSQKVHEKELFRVCGYFQGRVCLRDYRDNLLVFGNDRELKIIPDSGIKSFLRQDNSAGYWDQNPLKNHDRDYEWGFTLCRSEAQNEHQMQDERSLQNETSFVNDPHEAAFNQNTNVVVPLPSPNIPSHFWKLEDDELDEADKDLIILLLNSLGAWSLAAHRYDSQSTLLPGDLGDWSGDISWDLIDWNEDEQKVYAGALIDRLYNLSPDESPREMTTDEFIELSYQFEPLDLLYLSDEPDNIDKLYNLLMVKISDIKTLHLTKRTGIVDYFTDTLDSKIHHSRAPERSLFETDSAPLVNVDYFWCLIRTRRWALIHEILWTMRPVSITKNSAKTFFIQRHAEALFNKMRILILVYLILQICLTALLSFHVITQDNSEFNDIVVPLLLALTCIFGVIYPFFNFLLNFPVQLVRQLLNWTPFEHLSLQTPYQELKVFVNETWRFIQSALGAILSFYSLLFYIYGHVEEGPQLLAVAVFFAYMRLLSYLRLVPSFRKAMSTIIAVLMRSFKFYCILMIYIIATTFAGMALRTDYHFRDNFNLAYRMVFADFEDDYPTQSELIGFLVTSFFGPLLMLNLLIVIMGDAQAELQENWDVEKIRETYEWAQEMCPFFFRLERSNSSKDS